MARFQRDLEKYNAKKQETEKAKAQLAAKKDGVVKDQLEEENGEEAVKPDVTIVEDSDDEVARRLVVDSDDEMSM